jgi:hypothetical protein
MAHDHHGRVGPPRCEECNTPLNSDDRRLRSARALCLDCHLERNPFPRIKKRKARLLGGLHASVTERSTFRTAIPNPGVESW